MCNIRGKDYSSRGLVIGVLYTKEEIIGTYINTRNFLFCETGSFIGYHRSKFLKFGYSFWNLFILDYSMNSGYPLFQMCRRLRDNNLSTKQLFHLVTTLGDI